MQNLSTFHAHMHNTSPSSSATRRTSRTWHVHPLFYAAVPPVLTGCGGWYATELHVGVNYTVHQHGYTFLVCGSDTREAVIIKPMGVLTI
jgi:hypothetical protein